MFEGFVSNLGAIEPAYSKDLSLESGLGLSHSQVISLPLGFLLGALDLRSGEFHFCLSSQGFIPGLFRDAFGPLYLEQFLL